MNVGNLAAKSAPCARRVLGKAEHRAVLAHVGPRAPVARCLASSAPGATWAREGRRAYAA